MKDVGFTVDANTIPLLSQSVHFNSKFIQFKQQFTKYKDTNKACKNSEQRFGGRSRNSFRGWMTNMWQKMEANKGAFISEGERLGGSAKNEPLHSTPIKHQSTINKLPTKI